MIDNEKRDLENAIFELMDRIANSLEEIKGEIIKGFIHIWNMLLGVALVLMGIFLSTLILVYL